LGEIAAVCDPTVWRQAVADRAREACGLGLQRADARSDLGGSRVDLRLRLLSGGTSPASWVRIEFVAT